MMTEPMTWRRAVYPHLGNVNYGFEMTVTALEALRAGGVINDMTAEGMFHDLDKLWTAINFVIIIELYARESANQGEYDQMRAEVEKARKKLKDKIKS
jgi:hypothetical protein